MTETNLNLQDVLSALRHNKVKIWVDGEKLRYRAKSGKLPETLYETIKAHRQELINFLVKEAHGDNPSDGIQIANRSSILPLSFAEERLWFISSLSSNKPVFQSLQVYRLIGNLDTKILDNSLHFLLARHEILRTRYVVNNGTLSRKIDDSTDFKLSIRILNPNKEISLEALVRETLIAEKAKKIDLENAWACNIKLLRLPDNQHIILFKLHHLIYDDRSMSRMWHELKTIYQSLLEGETPDSPSASIQYADFASWQRSISGDAFESSCAYWQAKLNDIPPVIELPSDYKRPLRQDFSGEKLTATLSEQERDGLEGLCQKYRVTKFMALLSLFSLLLHRYTNQSTVVVGSPITNRRSDELESVLGCFIDTIVLRTDFDTEISFATLLQNVRQTTLEAFDNQQVPFEKIVELLQPDRNLGTHPIYQVLFNFLQDRPSVGGFTLPEVDVERIAIESEVSADYDLSLTIIETDGRLNCIFTYSTGLYNKSTITRLLGSFRTLLAAAINNPDSMVAQYPLLTKKEEHKIVNDWNQTKVSYPADTSLSQLFQNRAEATPDKIALIYESDTICYAELNRRANQLGHFLISLGENKQSVVGVHLERSPEVTIALLAIYKIGAIYLPLDPSYPAVRLLHMLKTSAATSLITTEALDRALDCDVDRHIRLDGDYPQLNKMPTYDHTVSISADDIAYIIFTSGSTGAPKGVCVPHKQILNRMYWMWRNYPFAPDEVSCQKTAISFVDSLWELLGPLLQGSPSAVLTDAVTRDPQRFLQALTQYKITRLWLVPTLLYVLLEAAKNKQLPLPYLTFVVVSGESLPSVLAENVRREWPHVTLFNLYGTSEAWDSTWYEVTEIDSGSKVIPIGKPIDNTQMYILDAQLSPVPIGVIGQLYVSGDGLADHFLDIPDSDLEGFVIAPWDHKSRMLGSGDCARFLPDGNIDLLGRENGHINVRGYRVEPAEIENAIIAYPGVSRVAVVQHSGESDIPVLVASVLPESELSLPRMERESELRAHLKTMLPAYMIPNYFVFVDKFPTTPSGKIDRLALAEIRLPNATDTPHRDEPRSTLEADILAIWETVLPGKSIGIFDNFFDLGGHSLMAVELFDKLSSLSGKKLELTILFEASTVAEQASVIGQLETPMRETALVTIWSDGKSTPLFFVPPAAGTGLNYRKLTEYLGKQQPVYSFNLTKSAATVDSFETVEEMAKRFVSELRDIQPNGPYTIGGMCFGGLVAWEMACQLRAHGNLDKLILLDSSIPWHGPDWSNPPFVKPPLYKLLSYQIIDLANHRLSKKSRQRVFHKAARKLFPNRNDRLQQYSELRHQHARAWRRYKAEPLSINVLMICSNEFSVRENYIERWKSLINGRIEMEVLTEASHFELVADSNIQIELMGAKVRDYLERTKNAEIS